MDKLHKFNLTGEIKKGNISFPREYLLRILYEIICVTFSMNITFLNPKLKVHFEIFFI